MSAIKDAVDFALDADDILPLVRLVFSSRDQTTDVVDEAATKRSLDKALHHLQTISSSKNAEVQHAHKVNAAPIATAVADLSSVQHRSSELERALKEVHATLQHLDSTLVATMDRRDTTALATANIDETQRATAAAQRALHLCHQTAVAIDNRRLLQAQRLLEELHKDYIDSGETATRTGRLGAFVNATAALLEDALEKSALADLNLWLTHARDKARIIGERGIRNADMERQKKLERDKYINAASKAGSRTDFDQAATALQHHLHTKHATTTTTTTSSTPNAATSTSEVVVVDDPLCGLDMTPLHRATYVLVSRPNGSLAFQERYFSARSLQLATDLSMAEDPLEYYRPQLAIAVGHFLIENRVAATTPALSSSGHVAAAWEGASSAMSALVRTALDEAGAHGAMLGLKEMSVLSCQALDRCGRPEIGTEIVREAVLGRAGRYREALAENATEEIGRAKGNVGLLEKLASEIAADAEAFLVDLLPVDRLPKATAMETELVLAAALEALRAEQQQTQPRTDDTRKSNDNNNNDNNNTGGEKTVEQIAEIEWVRVTAILVNAVRGVLGSNNTNSTTTAANDDNTTTAGDQSSDVSSTATTTTTPASSSPLLAALHRIESDAGFRLASDIIPQLTRALSAFSWKPPSMQKSCGVCSTTIQPILAALEKTRKELETVGLPEFAVDGVMAAVLVALDEHIMKQLVSTSSSADGVKGFNVFGLQQFLSDLECLTTVRGRKGNKGGSLPDSGGLEECIKFCQLVVFGQVVELMDAAVRQKKYTAVRLDRYALLLSKLVVVPGMGNSKEEVDEVVKVLKSLV